MIREVLRHWFVRKKRHWKPCVQKMADLTSCRITEGEPPSTQAWTNLDLLLSVRLRDCTFARYGLVRKRFPKVH